MTDDHDWNSEDGEGRDWMRTYTGRKVWPLALKPSDVDIRDIAHATAMQCRYNGHVSRFYSVAEHQVHISAAVLVATGDRVKAKQGLLHDGGETFTGDMIRPMKNSLRTALPAWKEIEHANERAIFEALGVPYPPDPIIDEFDKRIIVNEKDALFGADKPWHWDHEPLDIIIRAWEWKYAEEMYLRQWGLLTGEWQPLADMFNGVFSRHRP